MPFQKGKTKTGGRAKGTPNKDNPLKTLLHEHSVDYFTPTIEAKDVELRYFIIDPEAENALELAEAAKKDFVALNKGKIFSRYELDLNAMNPGARAKVEIELLSFHTPKMQAISADMSVKNDNTISGILLDIAAGKDPRTNDQ